MYVRVAGVVADVPLSSRFETLLIRLAVKRCGYLQYHDYLIFSRDCFNDIRSILSYNEGKVIFVTLKLTLLFLLMQVNVCLILAVQQQT